MAPLQPADQDREYWHEYRDGVDRAVFRARGVVPHLQHAAVWVGAIIFLGVVGSVAGAWAADSEVGPYALIGAAVALPALLLLPLCAWALGALLDVQAWRLDIAALEADLEEAVGEG
jgi:hypothetical protein